MAGVAISTVRVTLTELRRLQSDNAATNTVTVAYTITLPAIQAAAVVERIVSTDLSSITTVVALRLTNAGFDGTVEAISLSANTVADPNEGSGEGGGKKGQGSSALLPAVLVALGYGVFNFFFFFYLCCARAKGTTETQNSSTAGAQNSNIPKMAPPTLLGMEEKSGAPLRKED